MLNTLLIANRGEIACRIIKTARKLGIETIAIYSTADKDSLHVTLADKAFCVGEAEARLSYLNISNIIAIAKQAGAQAIHPGYGFLSENPEFAEACLEANIIFVGPSVSAMKAMASKQLAKQLLSNSTVPLTPGYHGENQSNETLLSEAKNIGFPILLKAANGGGGKGMRIVEKEKDFQHALESARREAQGSFGDDVMIIEKYIAHPRHIEIQLMADNYGNVVHLFERDCSIQRRHQKIIEEAPAFNLSAELRQRLADAAIAVAKAIDYRGAGTVEFLVDEKSNFYFMEMNTRLQVEHPVTEMITGIDLVEWQLRIADNEPLPLPQDQIQFHGHAIECRIYAEDPYQQFLPSIGRIDFLKEPAGDGIRVDTGVTKNSCISIHYDPMISKLSVFGATREQAVHKMTQALQHYSIGGIKTNLLLLQAIIKHPTFTQGHFSTHFLAENIIELPTPNIDLALKVAASFDYLNLNPPHKTHLQVDTFGWQMHLKSQWYFQYRIHNHNYSLEITPITPHSFTLSHQNENSTLHVKLIGSVIWINDTKETLHATIDNQNLFLTVFTPTGPVKIERMQDKPLVDKTTDANHQLTSPMPATIVAILKQAGDSIKTGDHLMILEAMKMEHTIIAPSDGIIDKIFFKVGEQVAEGVELITLQDSVGQS